MCAKPMRAKIEDAEKDARNLHLCKNLMNSGNSKQRFLFFGHEITKRMVMLRISSWFFAACSSSIALFRRFFFPEKTIASKISNGYF